MTDSSSSVQVRIILLYKSMGKYLAICPKVDMEHVAAVGLLVNCSISRQDTTGQWH